MRAVCAVHFLSLNICYIQSSGAGMGVLYCASRMFEGNELRKSNKVGR